MTSDKYGRVLVTDHEVFEALYAKRVKTLDGVLMDSAAAIERFNSAVKQNADAICEFQIPDNLSNVSVEQFDLDNQSNWFMPDEYKDFLLEDWLYEHCSTTEETLRVSEELALFAKHKMTDALRYLKYLVDTMRDNNILWGVGRGSSVASYCLFLLGVHRIDSIRYGLDIHEFLK